jgi:hypothetical protein
MIRETLNACRQQGLLDQAADERVVSATQEMDRGRMHRRRRKARNIVDETAELIVFIWSIHLISLRKHMHLIAAASSAGRASWLTLAAIIQHPSITATDHPHSEPCILEHSTSAVPTRFDTK